MADRYFVAKLAESDRFVIPHAVFTSKQNAVLWSMWYTHACIDWKEKPRYDVVEITKQEVELYTNEVRNLEYWDKEVRRIVEVYF